MSLNPTQRRDTGGRWDFAVHIEPNVQLLGTVKSQSTAGAVNRRAELRKAARGLHAQAAVQSAAAIASHTRDLFPDAKTLRITADDVDGGGAQVDAILDGEGRTIAARNGELAVTDAYWDAWEPGDYGSESMSMLAADLGDHDGLLNDAMTAAPGARPTAFGVNAGGCKFTLDIDAAMRAAES